jgi:ribosomal protein S16
VKDWLAKGAQPSDTVSRLLKAKNIEAEGKGASGS